MFTGTQFTGSLNANQTKRWVTAGWSADWHVVWYVVPTSPKSGAPQVTWEVGVERAGADQVTYHITVKNLTTAAVTFEGRYAVLKQ